MVENVGVIEEIEGKVTKAGKPFKTFRISDQFFNDFSSTDWKVRVGDRVKFIYNVSEDGRLKNLEEVAKLVGGGAPLSEKRVSPAFFGMVMKMAVEEASRQGEPSNERVTALFERFWNLAEELKKVKGVE